MSRFAATGSARCVGALLAMLLGCEAERVPTELDAGAEIGAEDAAEAGGSETDLAASDAGDAEVDEGRARGGEVADPGPTAEPEPIPPPPLGGMCEGFTAPPGLDLEAVAAGAGGRFVEVTGLVRVDEDGGAIEFPHYTSSLAVADFDDNGTPDVVVTGLDSFLLELDPPPPEVAGAAEMVLYANCGGWLVPAYDFTAKFGEAFFPNQVTVTAVDVDGTGTVDLLVGARGGALQLVRGKGLQNGKPKFSPPETLVPPSAIPWVTTVSTTVWDFDRDGLLDVWSGQSFVTISILSKKFESARDLLLLQQEDGSFEEVLASKAPPELLTSASRQTFAGLAIPLPEAGRTLFFGGVDQSWDYWVDVAPKPLAFTTLEVPQDAWLLPFPFSSTMGADFACADAAHCWLVASDVGGPQSYRITRGPEGAAVERTTDADFGIFVEEVHNLWTTVLADLDRDGRDEVLLAGGEFTAEYFPGPADLPPLENLVAYGFDDALGRYTTIGDGLGPLFDGSRLGSWGAMALADLDQDGDLDLLAAGIPRTLTFSGDLDASPEEYQAADLTPTFDPGSPLVVAFDRGVPTDGHGLEVRLRGPGSRVLGSRVEVLCREPGCEGLQGLWKEATANGDFLGFGREPGVFHVGLGAYAGVLDVRVTSPTGEVTVVESVLADTRVVVDVE